jgi:hypothetical protein
LIDFKYNYDQQKFLFDEAEKEHIKSWEDMIFYWNKARCLKNQIERVIEWLETDLNYCDNIKVKEEVKPAEIISAGTKLNKIVLKKEVVKQKTKVLYAYRHEWNDERNDRISYMYEKSWFNKDLVKTFLSENDNMWLNRPSIDTWYNGERAYWLCQLYYTRHKPFIKSDDFNSPYKQIDYCIWVWKDAEKRNILEHTFQAYPFRENATKKLVFLK